MNHEMILFKADMVLNETMRAFDLRPEYKWFVEPLRVQFRTSTHVTEKYFIDIILKSKETKDASGWWVPMIQYMGTTFYDPEIKVLSDGSKEMYISSLENALKVKNE